MSHVLSFTIAFTILHAKLTFVNSFYIKGSGNLPRITPLYGEVCITKSFRTGTERGTGTGTRTEGQGQGEWDARM